MISERRHEILNLIIEHYLRTGEPIGSKALCQLLPYPVSSATVRNEMAYLSQLGFLEQRHTSGGRVPGRASYRYYVDTLMQEVPVSPYNAQQIDSALSVNSGDPERLFSDAARLLSDYTSCAAFCCMPEDRYDSVQGVDIITAGSSKAMLVMLTSGSKVKSSLINMPCALDEQFKKVFYAVMSEHFIGTPLSDITPALVQNAAGSAGDRMFDLLPALISLCALCGEASQSKLVLEGETNLLSHTELGSGVYRLLSFLTEKQQLIKAIEEFAGGSTPRALYIGDENPLYEMKNTSTAIARYTYGNGQTAAIGIVGSMRIDYKTVLPTVNYVMDTVDLLLSKGGSV